MLNHLEIHGYLGRDPVLEYRDGKNGRYAHVSFSVGVGRSFDDNTDWFFCVMNGKRAEVIDKWFRKGSQIVVVGRMESYPDKENPKRSNWVVIVNDFDFCDSNNKGKSSGNQLEPVTDAPDSWEQLDEDNPFN